VFSGTLTLKEAREFFSNTHKMYCQETGEYYPGLDISVLWEKAGIKPVPIYQGAEEYLFGYGLKGESGKAIYYPVTVLTGEGDVKVLRVSASVVPDYQFLFFIKEKEDWVFFEHIDLFSQKYEEPEIKFLGDDLFYIDQLEFYGSGVSWTSRVFYAVNDGQVMSCLKIPVHGWVSGWGMMASREFSSSFSFTDKRLTVEHKMDVLGDTSVFDPDRENESYMLPLFSVTRKLDFTWTGRAFEWGGMGDEISWRELLRPFDLNEKEFFKEYKSEFEALKQGNGRQKDWYAIFMKKLEGI